MLHEIKRLYQRFIISMIRKFNSSSNYIPQEFEKESFAICRYLIKDINSTLLMSPISGKRYTIDRTDAINNIPKIIKKLIILPESISLFFIQLPL